MAFTFKAVGLSQERARELLPGAGFWGLLVMGEPSREVGEKRVLGQRAGVWSFLSQSSLCGMTGC